MGSRESSQWQTHTHTDSVARDTQVGWSLGQGSDAILTHVCVARQLFKLRAMNIARTQWLVGGACNGKHTHTNTHTHPHSVPRNTQDGWKLGQDSDAILAHEGWSTL